MGLSHAQQSNTNVPHDSNSYFQQPAAAQTQHNFTMASGAILDHDTKVHLFKQYRQFWASGPAAAVAVIAGSPFENVKTRMQSYHFSSAYSAAKFVYYKEGIRGFWAGTLAPLVSITANRVAGFIIYRHAKYEVDRVIESTTGESPLQWVNTPGTYPNLSTLACFTTAGVIQGAILTPILTPIELLKNASQTAVLMSPENRSSKAGDKSQSRSKSAAPRVSTISAASQIIRNRGVLTLWTGFRLHLVRDMIGGGVYFGVYESCKQALGSFYGDDMKNTPWAIPLAGAICGISSWVITYPIDTMKTRAQNQLLGVPQPKEALNAAATAISKSSKWKGIEMVIIRTAIQNMIQMTAFEQVKVWIDNAKFKDGSTNLPSIQREKGRDRKILKVISEGSDK